MQVSARITFLNLLFFSNLGANGARIEPNGQCLALRADVPLGIVSPNYLISIGPGHSLITCQSTLPANNHPSPLQYGAKGPVSQIAELEPEARLLRPVVANPRRGSVELKGGATVHLPGKPSQRCHHQETFKKVLTGHHHKVMVLTMDRIAKWRQLPSS